MVIPMSISSGQLRVMVLGAWIYRHVNSLFHREPWWTEFWSGVTCLIWVYLAIMSPKALSEWGSTESLVQDMSGVSLISMAAFLGGGQLTCSFINNRWARWVSCILMCGWWILLIDNVSDAVQGSPTLAGLYGWAAANGFSILRLLSPRNIYRRWESVNR